MCIRDRLGGSLDDGCDLGVDLVQAEVRGEGDALAFDGCSQRLGEVYFAPVDAERIARIVVGHLGQRAGSVLDGSGLGAVEAEGMARAETVGARGVGYEAERRLVADDAAPGCRNADRAASIGAFRYREQSVGDRGRGTARGAARVVAHLERGARCPVELVVARAAEGERGGVGLADE